jgi:hypothetical protein
MDRVSSCSVYVVQPDTQCSCMIEFIHKIISALQCSGRYGVVGRTSHNTVSAGSIKQYVYYRIKQYVYYHLPIRSYSLKDAPEDGHMRSETL